MLYQFAYEIWDIIREIWPIIIPIMTMIFFNMLSQQQHINMQIRYSVDQFMDIFTHIFHKTKWYIRYFCNIF